MQSTGIKSFDKIITGLRLGDNVVWQVDEIEDYRDFVAPFARRALEEKRKVVYIRFASHEPLLKPEENTRTYSLDAQKGFESFTREVNNIITKEGKGAYYVFDCLSFLLPAWATDFMVGSFFKVTCPYLYRLDTIAYFSILRNSFSYRTTARIRKTSQLLLNIYRFEGNNYVHPLKVLNRYSPTMFLPHLKNGDDFVPVTDSTTATNLLSTKMERGIDDAKRNLDYWDRLFLKAEELIDARSSEDEKNKMIEQICRVMITQDKKILSLVVKNFSLEDLLKIKSNLIGTGFIGGKAVGMLLAKKILSKDNSFDWQKISEPHDSFFVGSDVFYAYIVQNGWWDLHMRQRTDEEYFEAAAELKEKILHGTFLSEIEEQFKQMIEYFGSSPMIVRSSSLLEDGFGNAFAGKYESVFLANQTTPEQRYFQFAQAVRKIFASTLNEDALTYRRQRGLDKVDEQMALLIQRVSGVYRKHYFFPDFAGVGHSHNMYIWTKKLNPEAGMLRLVLGLGTRAVSRAEGDYLRIVALDAPLLRPHSGIKDERKFSQHYVDVIDLEENSFKTVPFDKLIEERLDIHIEQIAKRDDEAIQMMKERGKKGKEFWILSFDRLLSNSTFVEDLQKALKILENQYQYPVDIEFAVNFTDNGTFRINLLQCRPLETKGLGEKVDIPENINKEKIVFESKGGFLGGNISQRIQRIIYINPEKYNELTQTGKYDIARIVGKLNKQIKNREEFPVLLLGPGRWGSTTPSLGVPTKFSEINNIAVLGEIAFASGDLMPELSFGTHFFQDLVETEIFYAALFPEKKGVIFNEGLLLSQKNLFEKVMPEFAKYKDVIGVYDIGEKNLSIMSDVLSQKVICFFTQE
jgi:hypothetical protein